MRKIENILLQDYMNLVLVANGLKPATEIGFQRGYGHNHGEARLISLEEERQNYAPQKQKRMQEFQTTINKFPLIYDISFYEFRQDCDFLGCNEIFFNEGVQFYIAKEDCYLNNLLAAKTQREYGEAFGFPQEAIEMFVDPKNKGVMFAVEMYKDIAQAMEAGISIPSWLAYISFVPEKTDFLHDDVSESSRAVGERYQSFIQQNHPGLAKIIEDNFASELHQRVLYFSRVYA